MVKQPLSKARRRCVWLCVRELPKLKIVAPTDARQVGRKHHHVSVVKYCECKRGRVTVSEWDGLINKAQPLVVLGSHEERHDKGVRGVCVCVCVGVCVPTYFHSSECPK